VAINDNRTYAVLHRHNADNHNADKLRVAVERYGALVDAAAAAGAKQNETDKWTHKRMMFTALAMVGEISQNSTRDQCACFADS
jgi:hypothetical protein